MEEIHHVLLRHLLKGIECMSAIIAAIYFFKLKGSYWRWFCIYLFIISFQEIFWSQTDSFYGVSKATYFAFLGIPLEYIFLYWLYAYKSLKNKKLFIVSVLIFLIILPIEAYLKKLNRLYSINLNVGTIILVVLVVLEFIKQIKNDDILKFRENKMFYINVAIILFWLGTYPFHAFRVELHQNYRELYFHFYTYFLITNCLMYLLFIASFIWGKEDS